MELKLALILLISQAAPHSCRSTSKADAGPAELSLSDLVQRLGVAPGEDGGDNVYKIRSVLKLLPYESNKTSTSRGQLSTALLHNSTDIPIAIIVASHDIKDFASKYTNKKSNTDEMRSNVSTKSILRNSKFVNDLYKEPDAINMKYTQQGTLKTDNRSRFGGANNVNLNITNEAHRATKNDEINIKDIIQSIKANNSVINENEDARDEYSLNTTNKLYLNKSFEVKHNNSKVKPRNNDYHVSKENESNINNSTIESGVGPANYSGQKVFKQHATNSSSETKGKDLKQNEEHATNNSVILDNSTNYTDYDLDNDRDIEYVEPQQEKADTLKPSYTKEYESKVRKEAAEESAEPRPGAPLLPPTELDPSLRIEMCQQRREGLGHNVHSTQHSYNLSFIFNK